MKNFAMISLVLLGACATEEADDFSPLDEQAVPNPDGKSDDARACGDAACVPRLCGYDCTTPGAQCTETCAPSEGRASAFVTATIGGATVDSRDTPYQPVWDLDNVLVYGCELWDFSNQEKDGLQIQLTELHHSSFVVNPNDPRRHDRDLFVYVAPFTGPGSYRGEGKYRANQDAPLHYAKDACSVDVDASADGGIHGTFDCRISSQSGSSVDMRGEFACPIDAMSPVFSRWMPL